MHGRFVSGIRSSLGRMNCSHLNTRPRINIPLQSELYSSGANRSDDGQNQIGAADHFQTLGVDRTFRLSSDELKSKYKNLMRDLHPDRHTTSSEEEKSRTSNLATTVTHAYSILSNPLSRALYMLELWGAPIDESDSSIADPSLLLEIMEIREEVENASTDDELKEILVSCQSNQKRLQGELEEAFDQNDVEGARYLTASLQYWKRIEVTILEKMSLAY